MLHGNGQLYSSASRHSCGGLTGTGGCGQFALTANKLLYIAVAASTILNPIGHYQLFSIAQVKMECCN